jgi:hypothetical protein
MSFPPQPPPPPPGPQPPGQPGYYPAQDPYAPQPGGIAGQPGYGGQQPPYGGQPGGQFGGQYGAPAQPGQPAQPAGWGPPQQQPGAPPFGQPPHGAGPAGFGHPGGYGPPPTGGRKTRLPWILGGAGGLLAIVVVVVLIVTLGGGSGGSGGTDSPRGVAQAFVTAVNDRTEPDRAIYCESFASQAESATPGLPSDLPEFDVRATLGDVTENGDSATAVVTFEVNAAGQTIKGDYKLDIKKENGDWKICGLEVGDLDVPGLGG